MRKCKGGCFRWAAIWSDYKIVGYRCSGCGNVKPEKGTKK